MTKVTMCFGAKEQGGFGSFADTVEIEVTGETEDEIIKGLTSCNFERGEK